MFNIGPSNPMQLFQRFGGQNSPFMQSEPNGMPMRTPMNGGFAGPMGRPFENGGVVGPRNRGMFPMPMPQGQGQPQVPIGPSNRMFPRMPGSWGNDAEMRGRMGYNMGDQGSNPNRDAPPIDTPLPTFTHRVGGNAFGRRRF